MKFNIRKILKISKIMNKNTNKNQLCLNKITIPICSIIKMLWNLKILIKVGICFSNKSLILRIWTRSILKIKMNLRIHMFKTFQTWVKFKIWIKLTVFQKWNPSRSWECSRKNRCHKQETEIELKIWYRICRFSLNLWMTKNKPELPTWTNKFSKICKLFIVFSIFNLSLFL